MAYLAMARKWRPRNFEEMVGQDHIAQTIRNAIAGKRISHAYLFTGTRGVGKTTSARILAKALNCKAGPTATPCEACENCKAVNAGSSMDVLEIDAASNTGVDNIRDLREQVKYAPMQGAYKIYVVDEVHMLSKSAFNALLKTLEEPPPHVVFIFATTEVNKVPQTILSRVQRFDFKRISEARIRERLEFICGREEVRPEREALEAVARKADGSMRDALSLFDQVYAFSGADFTLEAVRKVLGLPRESLFDALLNGLASHGQKACFELLQDARREGVEIGDLLIAFGEYLRNLLFATQGVAPAVLGLSDARHAELVSLAGSLGLKDGDILLAGLKTAANPDLLVELGFARMAGLDRVVSLSQLLGGELPALPAAPAAAAVPPAAPRVPEAGPEDKKKSPDDDGLKAPARAAPPTQPASVPQPPAASPAMATSAVSATPAPATMSASAAFTASTVATSAPASTAPATPAPAASFPAPDSGPAADLSASREPETMTATLAPPEPAFPAVPSADAYMDAPDPDPDGLELDYPVDPEDPDMAVAPPPRPKAATAADSTEPVPVQDGPERLPAVWPRLVAELMDTRPILASQLRRTRLEWEGGGGSPLLRLVFLERSGHALLADDAEFRKTLLAFLGGKLRGSREFQLKYHLDEEAAASPEGASASVEDASGEEPIVAYVRTLFEGRTVG